LNKASMMTPAANRTEMKKTDSGLSPGQISYPGYPRRIY
jgi:hypothetical protein